MRSRISHANTEVLFDEENRREFLTGFHKRKVARTEAARKRAMERERQDRLRFRKEQREALRLRAKENARQVEQACGADPDDFEESEDEWQGVLNGQDPRQEEYEDEQVMASVTVEEDFDPQSLLHDQPLSRQRDSFGSDHDPPKRPIITERTQKTKSTKKRPQKIKYQTKAARTAERRKQHSRHTEKAELAGGKASRKSGKRKKGRP